MDPEKKYDLSKSYDEKLKLFMMHIWPSQQVPMAAGQRNVGIIGYKIEEAMERGRMQYTQDNGASNQKTIQYFGDFILIEDLLRLINSERIVIQNPPVIEPAPSHMTKEKFLVNLKMVANEFVKNEADKSLLLQIIGNIEKT